MCCHHSCRFLQLFATISSAPPNLYIMVERANSTPFGIEDNYSALLLNASALLSKNMGVVLQGQSELLMVAGDELPKAKTSPIFFFKLNVNVLRYCVLQGPPAVRDHHGHTAKHNHSHLGERWWWWRCSWCWCWCWCWWRGRSWS